MKIIHRYDVDQIKTTSTERTTLDLDKYAGVPFLETDTGNFYIHNGLTWTGPYTTAEIALGGYVASTSIDWVFGSDNTYATLTVAVETAGAWVWQGALNPESRSLVIVNKDATTRDYSYSVEFSRNAGGTTDDAYSVVSVIAGAKSKLVAVDLSAFVHDAYARIKITPTALQAGDQLQFKAYLIGRGG